MFTGQAASLALPAGILAGTVYFYRKKRIPKTILLGILILDLAGAAAILLWILQDGLEKVQALSGESQQGENALEVETENGKKYNVTLNVPWRQYSKEEAAGILKSVPERLDREILGKNKSFQKVEWDLNLVTALDDTGISIEWYTDKPKVLDMDGIIGVDVAEDGEEVTLSAVLRLQDEEAEYERILRVYPSKEAEGFSAKIRSRTEQLNEGKSTGRYRLPEEVDGVRLKWFREKENNGVKICVIAAAMLFYALYSSHRKTAEAERKRKEALERDYPELVSKIQLYMSAGLTMRKIMERISVNYARDLKNGNEKRAVYEEVRRSCYEMRSGTTEREAYTEFGNRCALPSYKTLALLLNQNLRKGGAGLVPILENEVQKAYENRRRLARVEGEKANIRMLIPMVIMLAIVFALIMIPALLSL